MNSVTLPWPPKELSPNARIHWSKKARAAKKYLADCYYLAKQDLFPVEWEGPIKLKITFSPPDARHRDLDNMVASIKSGLDGLAMAAVALVNAHDCTGRGLCNLALSR